MDHLLMMQKTAKVDIKAANTKFAVNIFEKYWK